MRQKNNIPQGYKDCPLGIIPVEWEVKKLGEIFKLSSGKTKPQDIETTQKKDYIYPVYGGNGILGFSKKFSHFSTNIIIGRVGEYCGNTIYVKGKYWITDNALFTKYIDNRYDIFFLTYKLQYEDLSKLRNKGGQPLISQKPIYSFLISIPPLLEQQKIAEILSVWDEAIAKQTQLIAQLETSKRGLMQQLLTGKKRLKGFEWEWREIKLGEIADIKKGTQINKVELNPQNPYPVMNGGIEYSGYHDKFNTDGNTVTISEGGNSCGFVNLIATKFWCGGHCYALFEKESCHKVFLYQKLKHIETEIMALRVGSGLPNIQIAPLYNLKITIPFLEEQIAIVAILSTSDKEIDLAKKKLAGLKEQKKGLMQILLTGKKRVRI
jgi:type I restriction enzyme S subunit